MEFRKLPRHLQNYYNDHSYPTTRRDFLSLGLTSFAGFSLLNPKAALARGLFNPDVATPLPGYVVIDCTGGAGLPGTFLVGKGGGALDLLPNYDTLGWNPRKDEPDLRFGAPIAPTDVSRISEGMVNTISEAAQKNFRLGTLLHRSSDDTSRNKTNTAGLAHKAQLLANSKKPKFLLGQSRTNSGGRSSKVEDTLVNAFYVGNVDGLNSLSGLNEYYESNSSALTAYSALHNLSKIQNRFFSSLIKKGLDQSYLQMAENLKNTINFDGRRSETARTVFGINENTNVTDRNAIIASLVHCSVDLQLGPSVLTIGGCDYHGKSETQSAAKDLEIGQTIGRVVEFAHQVKKPVFIHLITDGGVSSNSYSRRWRSDSGNRSMSAIGYYDPNGPREYRTKTSSQIGGYNTSQAADTLELVSGFTIGDSPTKASFGAFANYMAIHGQRDLFKQMNSSIFTDKQFDSLMIFGA